ncbi:MULTISPECIES: YqzH family protein [Bacillus]|uniref:YqzH family protein n=1 Tax=Bacillus xiapuensis TaxID=2014075 RepID=A0ABU6NAL3_9BACI|nr:MULTISPECIES: YqzH family protein [Bacillus]MED3561725.1 YqzH family protein [Bacillus xiapuensis]
MDKKLVIKMIRNCFKQYNAEADSLPMSDKELEKLYYQVLQTKTLEPEADLYEVINDTVYEFLTG